MADPYLYLQLCVIFSSFGTIPDGTKSFSIVTEPINAVFYKVDKNKWVGSMNQNFYMGDEKGISDRICDSAFKDSGLPVFDKLGD